MDKSQKPFKSNKNSGHFIRKRTAPDKALISLGLYVLCPENPANPEYFCGMKAAALKEIKNELETQDPETVRELCMRLAKYKKESKELLTYLLFEAGNEQGYIENVKEDITEMFKEVPSGNTYYTKKSLRKILRFANRQIKYSGLKETELALRISFCSRMRDSGISLQAGTIIFKLYQQQMVKILSALAKLPEDLQADYQREVDELIMS